MALEDKAVEKAGFSNPHCRSEVPHVQGCWAVDLILSKE
jgi:hypothetical protein